MPIFDVWRDEYETREDAAQVEADDAQQAAQKFREMRYKHEDHVYLEEIRVALKGSKDEETFDVYAHRVVDFEAVLMRQKEKA